MKVYLVRKDGRYLDSQFGMCGMETMPTLRGTRCFINHDYAQVVAERCGGEVVEAVRTADNKLEVVS